MSTKFSAFDAAEYLDSEEAIAAYLNEVIAEEDQDLLLSALDDVARARGMSRVADDAGLTRPSLYKALKPGSKTGFATVKKLASALGLQMVFVPATKKATPPKARSRSRPVKVAPVRATASSGKTRTSPRKTAK